jgi:hypothetical protein
MIRRRPTSSSPLGADDGNDEGAILMEIAKHIKRDNNKSFALSTATLLRSFIVVIVILLIVVANIVSRPSASSRIRVHPVTLYVDVNLNVLYIHNPIQKQIKAAVLSSDESNGDDESDSNESSDIFNNEHHQDDECIPMHPWQLPRNSPWTCNSLHEMNMADDNTELQYLSCGGDRCAFQTRDAQDLEIVLKTPRYEKNKYNPKDYMTGWKDTIAMERLSFSPFVLDMYGNCGNSQLTEYAPGLNLYSQIKHAKDVGRDTMSSISRLKIGYHVASAVADVHSFEREDNMPSLAHNDLCCDQYLLVNGVYKLNDFHLSSAIYKDQDGHQCPEPPKGMKRYLDKTRSPESLEYRTNDKLIHRDKSDVWMMGNVLYYVLVKKWCFEGISTKKARQLLMNGKHSVIPTKFLNSTDPADQAMVKAILMAWVYNPKERTSARQIANLLKEQLVNLTGIRNDDEDDRLFRVSLPPLPDSFSDSSTDWDNNYQD